MHTVSASEIRSVKTTETIPAQKLFTPVELGALTLSHRVVMAPLTRVRSDQPGDIPNSLMAEYYHQRASEGGLIISEATTVACTARGYLGAPGIYTDAQVSGWKKVTSAVHAKGGHIFLQLWHVGRAGHTDLTGGVAPVAPSVVPYEGIVFTANGFVPASPHRALRSDEIPGIIEEFRRAAERAKAAGFDGVEIHGANGYLLDEFLQDGTNKRSDAYGGSIENRARLLIEVTESVASVWGGNRVGVRLSPSSKYNAMSDSNPAETFGYAAKQLDHFKLAYLHIIEPRVSGWDTIDHNMPPVVATAQFRKDFSGPLMAAGGFNPQSAEAIVERGDADLVVFGRYFISNPDLPHRIQLGLPLAPYDRATFYGRDYHGYTDYTAYGE